MRLYEVLLYLCRRLYMFRMIPSSIIRSVLLMVDEGIIRNTYSCLQKYNKSVYSRISLENY